MTEALCNGYQSLSADSPLSCVPHPHSQGHSSSRWASGQKGFFLHFFISSSIKPLNYSSLTSGTSDPRIPCKSSPVPYPPFPRYVCPRRETSLSFLSQRTTSKLVSEVSGPLERSPLGQGGSCWPGRGCPSTPGGYMWVGGSRAQDSGGQATLLGGVVG